MRLALSVVAEFHSVDALSYISSILLFFVDSLGLPSTVRDESILPIMCKSNHMNLFKGDLILGKGETWGV